jgi:hypothetical protein
MKYIYYGIMFVFILHSTANAYEHHAAKNDFDGDNRSDFGCYYPGDGGWIFLKVRKAFGIQNSDMPKLCR